MEIDVALIDICLPEQLGWSANIRIPALQEYTYADLVEEMYKAWLDGDSVKDCDPDDALDAIQCCVERMKERALINDEAPSNKVWDFQWFEADGGGAYAYFVITKFQEE